MVPSHLEGSTTDQTAPDQALDINTMTIPGIPHPAVPYGSTIVVTGASGLIGSHVVDQALAAGYKVRATSRSAEANRWLVDHFNDKYGAGSVGIVEVADMEAEGAFNDVVKGTYAFAKPKY
jgi:NADPH:quinone reductase-like Zn-dependent oxidoreductase